MNFPFQERPEKIKEIIGQKIEYLSILVEKNKPMIPLISWMKTGDGMWHRFFMDAWELHWVSYNETEKTEIIEDDFEDGQININDKIWVVRNIMDEYNLSGEIILDAQLVYLKEESLICAQAQICIASGIVIYLNDYGDEINANLNFK